MFAVQHTTRGRALALPLLALLGALALAGCSGSSGGAGAAGPTGATGPAGPPGSGNGTLTEDISLAQTITATITGVTGGSTPTVSFYLVDQVGRGLTGLQPSSISFAIARLTPGNNGTSSTWQSYINTVVSPGTGAWWGTTPARQATVETANAAGGVFTDNKDGTYTYAFAQNLGAYTPADATGPAVTYDGTLTHRIGLEIRGTTATPTNNAAYTWLPSTGATTGIFTRDIVSDMECYACHDKLALHGGPRTDAEYCVICHNPGTTDPHSGNTLDMKVMIHKIHMGVDLPTVVAAGSTAPAQGVGYVIWGYMNTLFNFNTVVYPQDQRNCTTCHNTSDPATPDTNNYQTVPNAEACGTCHDTVNFTTGLNHSAANLGGLTDSACVTCHGPNATAGGGGWQVAAAHVIPEKVAGTKFSLKVLSAVDATSGNAPVNGGQLKIAFSVTDPTNSNAPYNLASATPFSGTDGGGLVCRGGGSARLAIDVAWSTGDYTNFGSNSLPAQPWSFNPLAVVPGCPGDSLATYTGPDANGVYTLVTHVTGGLPAGIGTLGLVFEGHPAVDTQNAGTAAGTSWQRIPVTTTVSYAAVNDPAAVPRRTAVDITKCDRCHNLLTEHGNNRTDNPQACAACHNPGATDGEFRKNIKNSSGVVTGVDPVDGLYEQTIDFKVMIHALHGAVFRASQGATPFVVYGFGNSRNDFSSVIFPGDINDCQACHVPGADYPVNDSAVQATTTSNGTAVNPLNPNPVAATSANMAVCSACHTQSSAIVHMTLNGGSRTVQKDANGRTIPGLAVETCAICHGPGAVEDVEVAHQVAQYPFN
jgi:OmcA/MtrC family decaheme c-type cytochrome